MCLRHIVCQVYRKLGLEKCHIREYTYAKIACVAEIVQVIVQLSHNRGCSSSLELLWLALPLLLLLVASFLGVEVEGTGCTCLRLFVGNGSLCINTWFALSG